MVLIPYRMETTFTRIPVANAVIIAINCLVFFLPFTGIITIEDLLPFVERDWDLSQMLGSMFLHADPLHLLGNMLFLWVFGNAINAAVGNIAYPFIYLCLGLCSSAVHLSFDAHAAIGASGAINGIVGLTLVLYPYNKIHNWYFFILPFWIGIRSGRFAVKAFWMVLYWNIFDFLAVIFGSQDGIGHWAHIGGLTFGVGLGLLACTFKLVDTYSPSIFDVLAGRAAEPDIRKTMQLEQQVASHVHWAAVAPELGMPQAAPVEPLMQSEPAEPFAPPTQPPQMQPSQPKPLPVRPMLGPPDIQLLRCVGIDSTVTCYIVNKGGAINNLAIKVPKGVATKMNPSHALRSGETGWIRFSTEDHIAIDSIEFILAFKTPAGLSRKLRYRCVPSQNSFTLVAKPQAESTSPS